MKRPMTLVSGILGLVSSIFLIMPGLTALINGIEIVSYDPDDISAAMVFLAMGVLGLAIGILALVFNIQSIVAWNKDPEVFRSKRGKMITALVFNFISIGLGFPVCIYSFYFWFMPYITMFLLIAAITLTIVDLCLENKRLAAAGATLQNTAEVEAPATEATPAPKADDLEAKIEKLNDMKSNGLINEEEYEELKKKYIREKLGM